MVVVFWREFEEMNAFSVYPPGVAFCFNRIGCTMVSMAWVGLGGVRVDTFRLEGEVGPQD